MALTKKIKENVLKEEIHDWKTLDQGNQELIFLLHKKVNEVKKMIEEELQKVRHSSERKFLESLLEKLK